MIDLSLRSDIEQLFERLRGAVDDLERASRVLLGAHSDEFCCQLERYVAAGIRFESRDIALRAALDAITCPN
jgi:hypothetical protein